ncbi:glycosyltransferase family A protein [Massilia sp. TS11]|uniref:glycosyltransferase family A protein n=1 Tax=Massilia sp. TS11 TaxID=2908003 RepID=UPI001EDC8E99|nr:glycosyltransferase family A protein [Massilia sp. TS11]MCG2586857.1 glycosyltransferase family 2 protein [Massilia sp. TS11]
MSGRLDVLIPTCNRAAALGACLATLAHQQGPPLRIVIADQSDPPGVAEVAEVQAVLRWLLACGHHVEVWRHLPRRGMAEQRAFLLSLAEGPACLFLDDDVLLDADLLARLQAVLAAEGCGFVGSALHGLSYLDDVRPHEQAISFWDGPVRPETVLPDTPAWARHRLHNAANLYHVQQARPGATRRYRVAWVGGCVLFDTAKLRAAGGFDFWPELPPEHSGEDVLAQLRLMARDGGCAILPSGAYHMELPTTIPRRPVDAPRLLWPPPRERA